MADTPVICAKCKYCTKELGWFKHYYYCTHPNLLHSEKLDIVTGVITPQESRICSDSRQFKDLCGFDGKYFEIKGT